MAAEEPQVSRRVEEALFFKLKEKAFQACKEPATAYAECCRGRTFSTVWACRGQLGALSHCLSQHTNAENMAELKRRWLAAGEPQQQADWDTLLRGL